MQPPSVNNLSQAQELSMREEHSVIHELHGNEKTKHSRLRLSALDKSFFNMCWPNNKVLASIAGDGTGGIVKS